MTLSVSSLPTKMRSARRDLMACGPAPVMPIRAAVQTPPASKVTEAGDTDNGVVGCFVAQLDVCGTATLILCGYGYAGEDLIGPKRSLEIASEEPVARNCSLRPRGRGVDFKAECYSDCGQVSGRVCVSQ